MAAVHPYGKGDPVGGDETVQFFLDNPETGAVLKVCFLLENDDPRRMSGFVGCRKDSVELQEGLETERAHEVGKVENKEQTGRMS